MGTTNSREHVVRDLARLPVVIHVFCKPQTWDSVHYNVRIRLLYGDQSQQTRKVCVHSYIPCYIRE